MPKQILHEDRVLLLELAPNTIAWDKELRDKEDNPLAVIAYIKDDLFKPGFPYPIYPIPKGQWEILGKGDELSEEQWSKIVDSAENEFYIGYKDYDNEISALHSATESGISLLSHYQLTPNQMYLGGRKYYCLELYDDYLTHLSTIKNDVK